jgi:hypothetical protein
MAAAIGTVGQSDLVWPSADGYMLPKDGPPAASPEHNWTEASSVLFATSTLASAPTLPCSDSLPTSDRRLAVRERGENSSEGAPPSTALHPTAILGMLRLPHQSSTASASELEPPSAPSAATAAAMDAREGRIGNAFACERCRKHKVRCVPSDAPSLCQRYVVCIRVHLYYPTRHNTCSGVKRPESSASSMLRDADHQNPGSPDRRQTG